MKSKKIRKIYHRLIAAVPYNIYTAFQEQYPELLGELKSEKDLYMVWCIETRQIGVSYRIREDFPSKIMHEASCDRLDDGRWFRSEYLIDEHTNTYNVYVYFPENIWTIMNIVKMWNKKRIYD